MIDSSTIRLIFATAVLLSLVALPLHAQQRGRSTEPADCPGLHGPGPGFCARCGHLTVGAGRPDDGRWVDAFFTVEYPHPESSPTFRTVPDKRGVATTTVELLSGEVYEVTAKNAERTVSGRVHAWGTRKAVVFEAKIDEKADASGRIVRREVRGVIQAKPRRFLFRTLDYSYDELGRLSRIDVATWHYRRASDWKKAAFNWVHHERSEILAVFEDNRLAGFRGTVRVGQRGLRGDVDFEERARFVDRLSADPTSLASR